LERTLERPRDLVEERRTSAESVAAPASVDGERRCRDRPELQLLPPLGRRWTPSRETLSSSSSSSSSSAWRRNRTSRPRLLATLQTGDSRPSSCPAVLSAVTMSVELLGEQTEPT